MDLFRTAFTALGGACELTFAMLDTGLAEQASRAAITEIERIEQKYSRYRPDSIVGQMNSLSGSGAWLECDEETVSLLDLADRLHQESDGLFDITSGILRNAWSFKDQVLPDPHELAQILGKIGWNLVERDGPRVRLSVPGMEIDFGGFGKEYAADRVAEVLVAHGVAHGIVNLGGDVRVVGPRPDGSPWAIGIQDPRASEKLLASIPLSQGALATSGDYERFFELNGKRYCHILHPRTGYPVSYWRSISIVGPTALSVGSYSTIAMLKEEGAIQFLQQSGLKFLAVDQQQRIFKN